MTKSECCILFPVYNDWKSLQQLIEELLVILKDSPYRYTFVAIDDASPQPIPKDFYVSSKGFLLKVLHLKKNMGHQAAITVGVSWVSEHYPDATIVVMDSDGEDDPNAVSKLIETVAKNPEAIAVAQRSKRQESLAFKLGYSLYKILFIIATGKRIRFGNFSAFSQKTAVNLLTFPELWWHFAGALLRSKREVIEIPVPRQKRYAGQSTMNIGSLAVHGIRAIAVFMDVVVARLAFLFLAIGGLAAFGVTAVIGVRIFSDMAIPGWASYLVMSFVLVFMQSALMFVLLFVITLLMSPFRSDVVYQDAVAMIEER